jgi:signal transduction histidine kinase
MRLPRNVEVTAYRVVQESLNNAVKYAGASNIRVSLEQEGQQIILSIADDGAGFDPSRISPSASGIRGMQDRVSLAGGEFILEAAPGSGTLIKCLLQNK